MDAPLPAIVEKLNVVVSSVQKELGRGSVLIQQECKTAGLPAPQWKSQGSSGVTLTFFTPQVTPQVEKLLAALRGEMSRGDLMIVVEIKDRKHFSQAFLQPALDSRLMEMTLPDKPKSSKQRYRLTPLGQTSSARISK